MGMGMGGQGGMGKGSSANRELVFRDHWYLDDDEVSGANTRSRCISATTLGLSLADLKSLLLMLAVGLMLFFGLDELGKLTSATRTLHRGASHADAAWRDSVLGQRMQKGQNGRQRAIAADGFEVGEISENRIRDGFCGDNPAWSGYYSRNERHVSINGTVKVRTRNLFYWYVQTAGDVRTDPLVLMLVGGPGCAATTALLTEGGPCHINAAMQTVPNEHAWTKRASVLWLDQPPGVGFSYGTAARDDRGSEDELAAHTYAFLQAWFQKHEERRFNKFFIYGATHYVPAVAQRIMDGNRRQVHAKQWGVRIPLTGVAIGSGLIDPATQFASLADFAYKNNGLGIHAVSDATYRAMKAITPVCVRRIAQCEAHAGTCTAARAFCLNKLVRPFMKSGKSIYDIRTPCKHPPLCYDFGRVRRFLQLPATLDALSVRHSSRRWKICNFDVLQRYNSDWMRQYGPELGKILDSGIKLLVFAGEADFICNWQGLWAWASRLRWHGRRQFRAAVQGPWRSSNGTAIGTRVSSGGFAFVRVSGAGHMVPRDQPAAAEQLFNEFLSGAVFKP